MVDNSGSTSRRIISYLGTEIFVKINHILTKFCPRKLGVPVIMTHRVEALGQCKSPPRHVLPVPPSGESV